MSKASLRRQMRVARGLYEPAYCQAASQAVVAHCQTHLYPHMSASRYWAFYIPMADELSLEPLWKWAVSQGIICLLPRCEEEHLVFHAWNGEETGLVRSHRGVLEPPAHSPLHRPDVIFVPGLAFSVDGHRLGYGKGYYDRTLAAYDPRPLCIGCAYEEQIVPRLPYESHDETMDAILTPQGVITPSPLL